MPKNSRLAVIIHLLFAGALIAGTNASQPALAAKKADEPSLATDAQPEAIPIAARTIAYGQKDVAIVKTKLRYTTLILLPKTETILDFAIGDKDFWVVNGSNNFAYIKPAKAGAQTNLNLVTASGNIYSFALQEVADTKAPPDLKVFVDLKDDAMLAASRAAPRFVATSELDAYRDELEKAKQDFRQAKDGQDRAVQQGISRFVSNVRFPYHFEAGKKPFYVRAMYHDDRFTYIQARPEETPTLYEIKDKEPNLVNFTYKDGVYVVEKILDKGYLVIGKQKLEFTREE